MLSALELELDTTQKPMTPFERSKALVERAKEAEARLLQRAADSFSDSENESKGKKRGGQPQAVTQADVADAIGAKPPTIALAVKHVEAVEANPDLKDAPQDAAIRENRWYEGRDEYPDFDTYCKVRWGMHRSTHNRLIVGAAVVEALAAPNGATAPATEGQARELAPLLDKPKELAEAWTKATAEAATKGVKVTAALHHQRRCAT